MRRFAFKLEKVLELREYHEREWELRLAEVTSRVIGVENEITELGERRHATQSVAIRPGHVDLGDARNREEYVNLIDDRVRHLRRRLVALEEERSRVRDHYLDASRERKALSKLKERRSEEYYKDSLKEEIRSLDEIAGSMTYRRLRSSEDGYVQ